ncbi:MAG TPA: hypothetical protein VGF94_08065 [Kofleriaceae bacterium]|jgi:hypothetical protein
MTFAFGFVTGVLFVILVWGRFERRTVHEPADITPALRRSR